MSTVEQIHHLETRIDRILITIRELRTANDSLRGDLAASQERTAELERQLSTSESARQDADRRGDELEQRLSHLHAEQEEIEATITRTLDQLGKIEIGATEPVGDEADTPSAAEAGAASDVREAGSDVEAAHEDLDDDAPDAETTLPDPDHGEQPGADEPEPAAEHKEGDDLDIF